MRRYSKYEFTTSTLTQHFNRCKHHKHARLCVTSHSYSEDKNSCHVCAILCNNVDKHRTQKIYIYYTTERNGVNNKFHVSLILTRFLPTFVGVYVYFLRGGESNDALFVAFVFEPTIKPNCLPFTPKDLVRGNYWKIRVCNNEQIR